MRRDELEIAHEFGQNTVKSINTNSDLIEHVKASHTNKQRQNQLLCKVGKVAEVNSGQNPEWGIFRNQEELHSNLDCLNMIWKMLS